MSISLLSQTIRVYSDSGFKIFILFMGLSFSSGCAKLTHMNELMTLKDLSEEQDAQKQYVAERDEQFARLAAEIREQGLEQYRNQRGIVRAFGEPVLVEEIPRGNETLSRWLYRKQVHYLNPEKVYLYFNSRQELVAWEHVPNDQ